MAIRAAAKAPAVATDLPASERPVLGMALLTVAMVVVPLMDGMAKLLMADLPVLQVTWARYTFHLVWIAPVLLARHPVRALWPRRPILQLVRSSCLLASTLLFFAGIAILPLADVLALAFVAPFFVTMLSPVVLGEQVGRRRWCAVAVGFLGALIVTRPGTGAFTWSALLGLGAGATYAGYLLTTRKLAGSSPPLVTLAITAVVGSVALTLLMPFVWQAPSFAAWPLMAGMGLLAAAGHFLIIKAFELAPASLLAPLSYVEIVGATLVGYVLFGDFPDPVTWTGIAVIVSSGIFILHRQRAVANPTVDSNR